MAQTSAEGLNNDECVKLVDASVNFSRNGIPSKVGPINLTIRNGEFVVIVGRSGCGKTTLLNLISALLPPSEGKIIFDESLKPDGRLSIGYVFQEFSLFPWRSVAENITFGLEVRAKKREEKCARLRECLSLVGLTDAVDLFPHELSGGMKQRVAIARALAYDPRILLMDEPFGSLERSNPRCFAIRTLGALGENEENYCFCHT